MDPNKEFNKLKDNYEQALHYVVYNGPPNTIYNHYNGNLNNTQGLIQGIKVCKNLYKYVINPSEQVTISHIENHGPSDLSYDLKITKNIQRAMIVHDHRKYIQFQDQFDDQDLINILPSNPHVLGYIKKQTYGMVLDAINHIYRTQRSRLYTEIFHGGSGIWHEDIGAGFVEYLKLECFEEKEIIKLYEIVYVKNNNSILSMDPRYISLDILRKYVKYHPEFLKAYTKKYPQDHLENDELAMMYEQMVDTSIYNFQHVDPRFQNNI